MAYTINLTKSKKAIIDNEDYALISQYKWYFLSNGNYACTTIGGRKNKKTILMHRLIMQTPNNMYTDHINHNGLDNRRSNLRICTNSQNQGNAVGYSKKTKFKGIELLPSGKWRARINIQGKTKHLGVTCSEIEAAQLYNKAAINHYGKFALTNKIIEGLI